MASIPSVSIGLAVYNGADDIEEALAGILQQTYTNFTLIVSDNASTDGTWPILERYAAKEPRIRLHRQPANIGLKGNFRFVLDQAESPYFMWHADDDRLAPNYLEKLLEVFEAEPHCALACPYGVRVSAEGATLHEEAFPKLEPGSRVRRIRTLLARPEGVWIYGLFQTQALREAFQIAESFPHVWAVDAVALLPFILNDRIRGTDESTFYYRVNPASLEALRPQGGLAMSRFLFDYARYHVLFTRHSELSLAETIRVMPWLLNHVVVSLFERPYRRFFKHPTKRFLRRIGLWPGRTSTNAR